jgi:uncharacterized protein (DUF305 family)
MSTRTIALSSGVLAFALVIAGCSASPEGTGESQAPEASSASSVAFNDADEAFAMMMIPHHEQAIEMADMLLDKDGVDERVTTLAQQIKDAQAPEIATMNTWLDEWGTMGNHPGMEDMDHSAGAMSHEDMAALESATGAEASTLFLEQMIEHHEGAIDMARDELDAGENPEALELAQSIVDSQTAEIATMQEILDTL